MPLSRLSGGAAVEIARVEAALERYAGFRKRVFTEAEIAYCDSRAHPAQHYAARFAGKEAVGKALGGPVHVERDRDRGTAEAGGAALGLDEGMGGAGRSRPHRSVDDALEGAGGRDLRRGGRPVRRAVSASGWLEPVYTAEEMREAEATYSGPTLDLMERAGEAVAASVAATRMRAASRSGGPGANGGDGLVVARLLHAAGRAVEYLLAEEARIRGDALENLRRAREAGVAFRAEAGPPTSSSTRSSERASRACRGETRPPRSR